MNKIISIIGGVILATSFTPAYSRETVIVSANTASNSRHNQTEHQSIKRVQHKRIADICLFGICAPVKLPGPVKEVIEGGLNAVAKQQLRKLLADEIPISNSEHKFYSNVQTLPGGTFSPRPLNLSALALDSPISPGDYEVPAYYYCTRAFTFNGRGNRFRLARLNGRMADVLSALYTRASYDKTISRNDVQVLSWSIQNGIAYSELSSQKQALVNQLIPEYKSKMEKGLVDRLTTGWNNVSRISGGRIPSLTQSLGSLGVVGEITQSALNARQSILNSRYSYSRLVEQFVPQRDVFLSGGTEATPWSQVRDNTYIRFIAPRGALNEGTVQVRILGNSSSSVDNTVQPVVTNFQPISFTSSTSTSGITASVLTNEITQSIGIPEASGHQAITASLPPNLPPKPADSDSSCDYKVAGFSLNKFTDGVCLYKHNMRSDYVTIVDLNKSRLSFIAGEKYRLGISNLNLGELIDKAQKLSDKDLELTAIVNGTVFNNITILSSRLVRKIPLGLKIEGEVVQEYRPSEVGTGFSHRAFCFSFAGAHILNDINQAFKDTIRCANLTGLYASSIPNEKPIEAPRTFVGVNNEATKVFFFSSSASYLSNARNTLTAFGAKSTAQLDGGSSVLLTWGNNPLLVGDRLRSDSKFLGIGIPSAIAIFSKKDKRE